MIFSIQRDWGPNVSIVRLVTDDSLQDVVAGGWLATQAESIEIVNNGPFEWKKNDVVLVSFVDPLNNDAPLGASFFYIFPSLVSLNPIAPIYPNRNFAVAHPGGGQSGASPLNIGLNKITTVATAGDSFILPPNVLGQTVIAVNRGANSCNVFPNLGDTINGSAPNFPIAVPVNQTIVFWGFTSSEWYTIASS